MLYHNINRIVIIGNGFDLAHGLKTRYEDFIDWYWKRWFYKLKECLNYTISDGLCKISLVSNESTWFRFFYEHIGMETFPSGKDFYNWLTYNSHLINIHKSPLLIAISNSLREKNWVDIEEEYYILLKSSLGRNDPFFIQPTPLNKQFSLLLELLIEYLSQIQCEDIDSIHKLKELIYEPINKNDISVSSKSIFKDFCLEIANGNEDDIKLLIDKYGLDSSEIESFIKYKDDNKIKGAEGWIHYNTNTFPDTFKRPDDIMLLSFNYTNLVEKYKNSKIGTVTYIHGRLSESKSIIFGYGDEMDAAYKDLLNNANNEYLTNVKTIKYLETDNYDRLLKFINSAPYQVYIMGHSCGNSDRTLLNTLFEHNNCVSIKPFYYQKEDGSDNYIEIVQNIYRNFTDMKLMRERVVSKTYCEPLPQYRSYVEEVE